MNDNSPTKPRLDPPTYYRVLKDVQLPHVGPGMTFKAGMLIELPPEYACKLLPGFLEPVRSRRSALPSSQPRR